MCEPPILRVYNKLSLLRFYSSLRSQEEGDVFRFWALPKIEKPFFGRAKRAIEIKRENLLYTPF